MVSDQSKACFFGGKLRQRLQHPGGGGEETAVVVHHPQVPKQLLYGAGPVERGDCRYLGRQRRYAAGGHLMPKESDGRLPKLALGNVEGEAALIHDLKNLPEML